MKLHRNPIAVVGMASVFPQAPDLTSYWDNILRKVDSIIDVPETHWRIDDYYDPDPTAPDKTYCKRGGFLPEIDFDPLEFGLPPNILEVTDTSQLISLVVARDALIDAGYMNAADHIRERTGVVLGVGGGQKLISPLNSRLQYPIWMRVLRSVGVPEGDIPVIVEKMKAAYVKWEENAFPGALGNVVSGRVANRFDLGGTNTVLDAACASSLSAVNLAVLELVSHRADMMITGGVDTDNSIFMYMCFSKTPAFSKGDRPRPFDTESSGMMVGEGVGMVVLKRLADAERDGDRIYAVIKGLGTSSDGRYKSIYAPRGEGQERALRRAYDDAGFTPDAVGLIEAHGTGTVAGDLTEAQTIARTFKEFTPHKGRIALGSVKSQIGHTKAAAGAAGLIKIVLALHHKILPPMINISEPNPKLGIQDSPLYLNTEARPWITRDGMPRRAGVSAFGFGGTNFHVVVEEYQGEQRGQYRLNRAVQPIVIDAASPADLIREAEARIAALNAENAAQVYRELVTGKPDIPLNHARIGFAAATPIETAEMIKTALDMLRAKPDVEELTHPKGIYYRKFGLELNGRVVALFPGQGSQYVEMARELALNFPELRETFAALDGHFARDGAETLSDVVFPPPTFEEAVRNAQNDALQRTEYAQPAIGAVSAGMWRLLAKAGFKAHFLAGHSFGELSALWAAGALSDEDYFALVRARGKAMSPPADPTFEAGTMIAVTGTPTQITALPAELGVFTGVRVANHNSSTQAVIAGAKSAVTSAAQHLGTKGYKTTPLQVSAAFHTPLVGHAHAPFAAAVRGVTFRRASVPVYANATGLPYSHEPATMQGMLADHILQAVQFRAQIENIYNDGGFVFVEVGPRSVLTNLVKDILGERPHRVVALNSSRQKDADRQFREGVAYLRVLGVKMGQIDPYMAAPPASLPKKKGMQVKIGGSNYISEKTRKASRDLMNDGWKLSLLSQTPTAPLPVNTVTPPPAKPAEEIPAKPVMETVTMTAPMTAPVIPEMKTAPIVNGSHAAYTQPSPSPIPAGDVLTTLERGITSFSAQQADMTRLQEQYLKHQAEAMSLFFQLVQNQATLAAQNPAPGVIDAVMKGIALFREQQAETLRAHESYIARQADQLNAYVEIIRAGYAALSGALAGGTPIAASTPPPLPIAAAIPVAPPMPIPPKAEAKPTPIPTPAIVSTPAVPAAPSMPPPAPTMEAKPTPMPAPVVVSPPAAAPVVAPVMVAPVAAAPIVNAGMAKALSEALLNVVSEKTGYPAETLELGMDIEADLGIDSIKRVEILGAMRDQFPELPQLKPEELAELRTLGQIVEYMNAHIGGGVPSPLH